MPPYYNFFLCSYYYADCQIAKTNHYHTSQSTNHQLTKPVLLWCCDFVLVPHLPNLKHCYLLLLGLKVIFWFNNKLKYIFKCYSRITHYFQKLDDLYK